MRYKSVNNHFNLLTTQNIVHWMPRYKHCVGYYKAHGFN